MRALLVIGLAVGVSFTATGCKNAQREVVVFFASDAPQSDHENALKACAGAAPHTTPEPITASTHRVARTSDVRFRIDTASDRDIARLEICLQKQPGVIGVQDTLDTT